MKRFLCIGGLSYMIGIIISKSFKTEWLIILAFVIIAIMVLEYIMKSDIDVLVYVTIFICVFIGIFHFKLYLEKYQESVEFFVEKPIKYTGAVIEQPIIEDKQIEYLIKINQIFLHQKIYPVNIKVKLYSRVIERPEIYRYGDVIEVNGILYLPSEPLNQGGFNYRYYLNSKGIYATSFVSSYQIKKIDSTGSLGILQDIVYQIRKYIIHMIDKYLPLREGVLLKGIMIGDTTEFTDKMSENFSKSGLAHVVAVSGLHVSILLLGITYILKFLRFNQYIKNILGIFVVILFILVSGCAPSVLRAGIMTVIFLTAYFVQREPDTITSLFFSAVLILAYNPIIIFDVGFQLSFCATLSILIFYTPIYNKSPVLPNYIREIVVLSIVAQLGTMLITAYYFNGISMGSLFSNFLVVPITSFILIGGIILVMVGGVHIILGRVAAGFLFVLLKFVLFASEFTANLPFSSMKVASPNLFIVIGYLLILYLLYNWLQGQKKYIKYKYCFCLLIGIIFISTIFTYWQGQFLRVVFINVGQGDCILIQSPTNKNILIDGGGSRAHSDYDIGKSVVMPYLYRNGIMNIDGAIISHYHDDHAKGILSLLQQGIIDSLFLSERAEDIDLKNDLLEAANEQKVKVYYLSEQDSLNFNKDMIMDILAPNQECLDNPKIDENNKSIVLRLKYGKNSFLFTGDIEQEIETHLVKVENKIDSDVLKLAHHGSDTSSTEDFIKQVNPQYAVICVGENNFGHPSDAVLQRLKKYNIELYRTDQNGTITFIADRHRIRDIKVFKEGG